MNDVFQQLADAHGGYFFRFEVLDSGFTDDHIRQAVGDKTLLKIRHGTYSLAEAHRLLSPEGRHRVVAHSVADRLGHAVALSHLSAVAEHGLDTYDVDLDTVHLTRLDGSNGRREAGVIHHKGMVKASEITEVDGRLIIAPARAVAEMCTNVSIESGMVTASSALRTGQVEEVQLQAMARRLERWKGVRHARLAFQLADPLLESVGEVRSLYMSWRWQLPRPELQYEVFDEHGVLLGRTDFAWLFYRHVGEFDGLVKYGRLNPYATDPGQAVVDEKVREDLIRAENLGMSRWTWIGLSPSQQRRTVEMIKRGMEQSRRLYRRNAVTISMT